ncbi:MAG TPA: tetratricopeptide repeat-containing protein [Burkholderiaceae bacterium]|nr:tetratricopeptide repeat-containing protein [Burkholderiaceae bacterium]
MQVTRAFIVRPFGVQEGIDFDRVERELLGPALAACGIEGRTTGEIARQGNIREDMFRLLVVSDVVIADVSIHNANVFYELGIRHGLCDHHTLLVRTKDAKHKYPFDLQTDRYFQYDATNPGADLGAFIAALKSTLAATGKDSPVFQLLPKLKPHDRYALMVVPRDFQDDVARAQAAQRRGDLRLLAEEAHGFDWGSGGLRVVGEAQFRISALGGARETFEALRRINPDDLQANFRLGTVYQKLASAAPNTETKLDYVTSSEQAIGRALKRSEAADGDGPVPAAERRAYRAEGQSLLGSNAKTRWLEDWTHLPVEARRAKALQSPHLGNSIQYYLDGYVEDLTSYYAGINALAMLKVQVELANALPAVWKDGFDDDDKAAADLKDRERRVARIAAALEMVLGVDSAGARNAGAQPDRWKEISRADLLFLTLDKPQRVASVYREALAGAQPFEVDAARRNVLLFRDLDLLAPKVVAALAEMQQAAPDKPAPPARIVLFTGHMLDALDRPKDKARFPPTAEAETRARALIEQALRDEMAQEGGVTRGIAGGACGSDILFHEVCEALGIPTTLLLALPADKFQVESVNRGGPKWVERYRRLVERLTPRVLADARELPRWLADKPGYDIWQRNNLWMMFNALAEDARNLTLVALYNRERDPDGPGGTAHLVAEASKRGFKTVELDARKLLLA